MDTPANERGNLAVLCLEAGLTRMESAVLMAHCGDGHGKAEVAARLRITVHAVECHLSNAGRKIREETERAALREKLREHVQRLREQVALARSGTAPPKVQLTSYGQSV